MTRRLARTSPLGLGIGEGLRRDAARVAGIDRRRPGLILIAKNPRIWANLGAIFAKT